MPALQGLAPDLGPQVIAEARRRITRDTLSTVPIGEVDELVSAAFVELEAEARDDAPAGAVVRDLERWIEDDMLSGDVVLRVTGTW